MSDELFAERHGFLRSKPITYRDELPESLVNALLAVLYHYTSESSLKQISRGLFDPYDTSRRFEFISDPNATLNFLNWYELFSLVEHVFRTLEHDDRHTLARFTWSVIPPLIEIQTPKFVDEINRFFIHEGIGWELDIEGKVVTRGDENFAESLGGAISTLSEGGRPTAAQHLKSSRQALSERPKPNTAGAVAHATSAVECVLHDITGETMTLGQYLSSYQHLFHPALRRGLSALYGYASDEGARHGKEGVQPSPEAARFVVATCSSVCTLLSETKPKTDFSSHM
jgi:hypothetical protein